MREVRPDFPLLSRQLDGRPLVYLDSAATALKPSAVLKAERSYSTEFTANVHRGKHALSEEASFAFESARARIARFVGADPREIVFTRNTTEGLNLVSAGLRLGPDDLVLSQVGEHHSNLVPWMSRGRVKWLECDPEVPLSPETLAKAIENVRPKVLALGFASNVAGTIQPVAALCRVAREAGVTTVVDAAQAAPHVRIDVREIGCDFLAFSAHKMLGPTGIGALFGRAAALEALHPFILGGGTVERVTRTGFSLKPPPQRFEGGTPHVSGAIGFAAAADYLEEIGFDSLAERERSLSAALEAELQELPGVQVVMARAEPRLAIATLAPTSTLLEADQLAVVLSDTFKIMVRSGFFCAHPLFDFLKLGRGGLRVSAYLYNTVDEVIAFGAAVRSLLVRMT